MKNTILVLTNSTDGVHSDIVISKLDHFGEKVFRFDVDRIPTGDLKIKFHSSASHFDFEFQYAGQTVYSTDIKSVWYRRPNYFNFKIKDVVQKRYAEDELKIFLEGLWHTMTQAFWLSDPQRLEIARKKVAQLKLAREIGFVVPKTIVSNDQAYVKEFFTTCNGKVVFKGIHHEFLDYGEKGFRIPTTLVTERHLQKLDLVTKLPCLFQEYIEKEYELRVTVIGEKIFPVKIDSQKNPLTVVDWRNPSTIDKLAYSIVDLPAEFANRCMCMIKELGLAFGAFDFAVSKTGVTHFLEVNPNGQWYWLEHFTGALISDAIVDILRSGDKDHGS